ncbi:MAG TPA: HEAT repeat domain-containing protein [Pirellulales bacterium]|nr:HEAT repeat domain-containing protein [Pirellulales bacterium]
MLDEAFEALKKFDWGTDLVVVAPIDDAVATTHGQADARRELEHRLVAALGGKLSRDAQDYVCRKLTIVGTAAAVPALASRLGAPHHSHMARFALERMPAPEAAKALRDALPKVNGELKIGVLSSIGARRDTAAIAAVSELLGDSNPKIATAAAHALGAIGGTESAQALAAARSSNDSQPAVIDALLACAESLLAEHSEAEAMKIYSSLAGDHQGRLVRLAATRGMLACASKQG